MMEISMNNLFDIESDQMFKNVLEKNSALLDEQIVERINITGSSIAIFEPSTSSFRKILFPFMSKSQLLSPS